MKTIIQLLISLFGSATIVLAADVTAVPQPTPKPEDLAKFEGVWRGKWNVTWEIEFTFKRTEGFNFDVLYRTQTKRFESGLTTYKGTAEYDPQSRRLKHKAIELFWHEDGKRLFAKGNFQQLTSYALLKRQPATAVETSPSDK